MITKVSDHEGKTRLMNKITFFVFSFIIKKSIIYFTWKQEYILLA